MFFFLIKFKAGLRFSFRAAGIGDEQKRRSRIRRLRLGKNSFNAICHAQHKSEV